MAKSKSIADHPNKIKNDLLTFDQYEIFYRRFQAKATCGCEYLSKITKAIIALSFLIAIESTGLMAQTLNVKQAAFVQNGYGSSPSLLKAGNVFVAGNYAYVTGQDYMQIIEITSPGNPIPRGVIYNGQGGAQFLTPTGIFVSGSYAYIVTHNYQLEIINISNPDNPQHIAVYKTMTDALGDLGWARGIHVQGNYAYISSATKGTQVIDVSKPAEPKYVTFIGGTSSRVTIATVKGITYAFMVSGSLLRIANISNPLSPITLDLNGAAAGSDYDLGSGNATDVAVAGHNVFVTTRGIPPTFNPTADNKLMKINVGNMASPQLRGTITTANINDPPTTTPYLTGPLSVRVFGSQVYVHGALGTLMVADTAGTISNAISHRASLYNANMANEYNYPTRMAVAGNHAYIPGYTSGTLTIVDVSNPLSPFVKKTINTGTNGVQMQGPRKVVIKDNFAYLISNDDSSLEIININNPYSPLHACKFTVANGAGNGPRSLFVLGTYAYIGTSNSIEIVDVSNPYFPVWVSRAQNVGAPSIILNDVRDLSALSVGGKTFVAAASRGSNSVAIIDVTNPASPAHKATVNDGLGSAPFLNSPTGIYIFGTDAYVLSRHSTNVTDNLGALQIIDLKNLAAGNPIVTGFLQGVGSDWQPTNGEGDQSSSPGFGANRIVIAQVGATRYAYIADTRNAALKIVNVTNNLAPVLTGNTGQRGSLSGSKGIALFDKYALVSFFNLDGAPAPADFGVDIWDVSNPALPVHVINPITNNNLNGTLRNSDGNGANLYTPISITVDGTYAYVAVDGFIDQGLSVLDLYSPDIASVSGFSPLSGSVGSSVTVNGSNFNTLLTATIDGIPATVTNVTASTLTLTVPPNATIGKIAIFGSKELARSSANFLVIPNANPATTVTQNSFTANWSDVGATTYFLDVSTNNSFSTFIASNNNRNVSNVTSASVSGLAPGTNYFYRIRSNDGTTSSGNSSFESVLTIPATPTPGATTAITQSGFTLNWNAVGGVVSNYFLDVATNVSFTNYVPGYNNLSVPGNVTTQVVSGLNPGTYYARIRSANASGSSPNSTIVTVATVPPNPIAVESSSVTSTAFAAKWNSSTGATSYLLDVSRDNFATFAKTAWLNGANRAFVSGNYAYVASEFDAALQIVDISNPAKPKPAGTLLDGGSGIPYLSNAYGIDVVGNYAYVSGYNDNALEIINVSNPAMPVHTGSLLHGAGGATLINPTGIDVFGNYAYIASFNGDALEIVDITNPNTPIHAGKILNGGTVELDGCIEVSVDPGGVYAYALAGVSGALEIIDITNKSAPTHVSKITKATVPELASARGMFVLGNYAYIVCNTNNALVIINITNKAAPVLAGKLLNGGGGGAGASLLSPNGIFVSGIYAYIASTNSNALQIVNVSNPTTPTHVGKITSAAAPALGGAFNVFVSGNHAYVPSRLQNALTIVDVSIPATPTQKGTISSASLSSINVGTDTTYNVSNVLPGTSYQYRARAINSSGTSGNSNIISTITIPAAPVAIAPTAITNTSFTANWNLSTGATSYTLEWSTNVNFSSLAGSYTSTGIASSYLVNANAEGSYFYRVTATNSSGTSVVSNVINLKTLSGEPGTQASSILFSGVSNTSFTINCTSGTGNNRLIVVSAGVPLNALPVDQISYNASPVFGSGSALGNGFVVSNNSSNSVIVTNLQPATTYFVQAFDFFNAPVTGGTENYITSTATGNPASQITLSTPPAIQPINLNFTNITSNSLSASFNANGGSPSGYLTVRSSTSGIPIAPTNGVVYSNGSTIGSNTVVYVGSATSFSESGLTAGSTYYYTVYPYNGSGSTLNYLTAPALLQKSVTMVPPAPVAGSATNVKETEFTANWSSANGATGYSLDVSSDNFITFVQKDLPVTGTSIIISNLLSGTSYQYRVRANIVTGSLVSTYSNSTFLITRPTAPVAQSPSSVTHNSFTARWTQPKGATDYKLEVSLNSDLSSPIFNGSTGDVSAYTIPVPTPGVTYYYRVTASNQTGSSAVSNIIQLTSLATPASTQSSGITFSSVTSNSMTVNFSLGNGTSHLVVASAGSPLITALPDNQRNYVVGEAIGNGFVVGITTSATFVNVTGLSPSTTYFFQVFDYAGAGLTANYLTTTAANNPASQATLASTSTLTQPANLVFSNITTTSLTGSFTAAGGSPSGYLVIRSTAASIPTAPVNGTTYITGSIYGTDRVAFAGAGISFNDSGLGNGITYYYTIYPFTGSGPTTNYLTSNPLQNSVTTIPPAPVIANASAIGSNGFTANWSATTGAVDYLLDISTDNFTTLVPGYSSLLVGSVTSYQAAGLIAGTSYRYRVRARNNSGISVSSNSSAVTTLPSPPTGLSVSNVADNSFSLTWSKSLGATGYFIDVSPNSSFTTLTYNNINAGDVSSFSIGGLTAGSTYYVRVRSSNTTGSSSNSSSVSATTYAVFPSQQSGSLSFSNVNSTSITANFTSGNGSSRLMVVSFGAPLTATPVNGFSYSADTKFGSGTPIGNGFVVSTGAGPVTATNLQPTSLYYFQVFEFNGSGGTENYNKQTVIGNPLSQSTISFTPLEQPTNLLFSGQTSSSVNVSFTPAVNNPSGYLVLRTTNAAPSVAPVNGTAYTIGTSLGNSVVASVGPSVSFFDGGLPTEKTYTYTVYAYNGVGSTSSYRVVNPLQANVILDTTPPVISFPISNPTSITEGNTPLFNATVTDNVSVNSVTFFYRGISQLNFKSVAMNSGTSNNYSVQIQSDWYDSLGLEYYVQAIDQNNNTSARGSSFFARLIKPSITLPSLPTGTGLADYRIVSFPYLLPVNNDVTTVYSNVPWNDNTKAGLWWWNPSANNGLGGYDQYGKSPTLRTIDPGKGYWVITSSPVTPQLTNVPAPNYNKDKLYQMNLKPGWNQIGNPYPISVSWDEVIAYNEARGSGAFGKLNIYDGQTIKEATGNTLLKAFQGGFVKNLTSSDITLQIPMPGQAKGGRKATSENSDITQEDWRLFLHIQQGGIKNELGGFGMHPKATIGEDPFDNFNIPAFVNAPEVQFSRIEAPKSIFSSDVVKTQAHFVWTFKPKGVGTHKARLSWNEQIITGDQQLFLLDEENLNIVDMSQVSYYDFNLSANCSFKIYYGKDALQSITSEKIQISEPHPNPVSADNLVAFKMALPQTVDPYSVQIQVFNLQGITIYKSEKKFAEGLRKLELELNSDLPAGTYLYQVVVSSPNLQESRTGKLIKK